MKVYQHTTEAIGVVLTHDEAVELRDEIAALTSRSGPTSRLWAKLTRELRVVGR